MKTEYHIAPADVALTPLEQNAADAAALWMFEEIERRVRYAIMGRVKEGHGLKRTCRCPRIVCVCGP